MAIPASRGYSLMRPTAYGDRDMSANAPPSRRISPPDTTSAPAPQRADEVVRRRPACTVEHQRLRQQRIEPYGLHRAGNRRRVRIGAAKAQVVVERGRQEQRHLPGPGDGLRRQRARQRAHEVKAGVRIERVERGGDGPPLYPGGAARHADQRARPQQRYPTPWQSASLTPRATISWACSAPARISENHSSAEP